MGVYCSVVPERAGDNAPSKKSSSVPASRCNDELPMFSERIVGDGSTSERNASASAGASASCEDENSAASSSERAAAVQLQALVDGGDTPVVVGPVNDAEGPVEGLRLQMSQQCSEDAEPYAMAENTEHLVENDEQSGVVRQRKKTSVD